MMRYAKTKVPYWAGGGSTSWSVVDACKMFMPCDGVTNGATPERVTGGVVAQNGYELFYDSALGAVHSNMLVDDIGYFPSPVWSPLEAEKYSLLMYAGYLHWADGEPSTSNGGRFALGSGGSFGGARYSLAPQHAVIVNGDDLITSSYNASAYGGQTETQVIEAAVGVGGLFYKFGIYNPSTGVLSVSIRNGETGAEIVAYADSPGFVFGALGFSPSMRLAGLKVVGAARFDFSVLPSNYLDLAFIQAAEWARGNKIILPYWGNS